MQIRKTNFNLAGCGGNSESGSAAQDTAGSIEAAAEDAGGSGFHLGLRRNVCNGGGISDSDFDHLLHFPEAAGRRNRNLGIERIIRMCGERRNIYGKDMEDRIERLCG